MAEIIDLVSSPEPVAKFPTKPKQTTASASAKLLTNGATNPINSAWSFDALSSDGESIESFPIAKPPAPAKPVLADRAGNTNIRKKSTPSLPSNGEAFITIGDESDDPFRSSSPPPAKRRRVSSSPQALPSKTIVPKAAGYKRSVSNIESSTRIAGSSKTKNAPVLKRASTTKPVFDDIMFTSSPDYVAEAARKRKGKKKQSFESDENEELPDLNDIGNCNAGSKGNRIIHTIDEDEHEDNQGNPLPRRSKIGSLERKSKSASDSDSSNLDSDIVPAKAVKKASKPKTTKVSSQYVLKKYNAEKARERAAQEKKEKVAQKAAATAAEKERKKLEREAKARQKEKDAEIVKANQKRTDKKVLIKEMIVDMASCLNPKLKDQIRTFLAGKEAAHTEYESTIPVIKWRRNVDREYNEEKGMWDAVPKRIQSEDHVMCVLPAKDFVELIRGEEGQDLDAHVLRLKAKHNSCRIIYMIEGYILWSRKNQNVKKKKFAEAVNSHMPQEAPNASQKRKKKDDEYIDEEAIEEAILKLQVVHGTLIHHTTVINDTAEWVVTFTEQISLRPDKLKTQNLDTTFCMETGQVKCGEDATDTFVKMLQEMVRVTQPVAWGIVSEYPTVQQLVRGFEEHGPTALQDCRKSANGNGAFQDKKIGQKISRRVYHVFMDRTPESTDV